MVDGNHFGDVFCEYSLNFVAPSNQTSPRLSWPLATASGLHRVTLQLYSALPSVSAMRLVPQHSVNQKP